MTSTFILYYALIACNKKAQKPRLGISSTLLIQHMVYWCYYFSDLSDSFFIIKIETALLQKFVIKNLEKNPILYLKENDRPNSVDGTQNS